MLLQGCALTDEAFAGLAGLVELDVSDSTGLTDAAICAPQGC